MIASQAAPVVQIRTGAVMGAAIFEAVNSIDRRFEPYQFDLAPPPDTSQEAAAAAAAYGVLVRLIPGQKVNLDTQLATSLDAIADGPTKADGIALGDAVASQYVALRSGDMFVETFSGGGGAYVPVQQPGYWQPTPPNLPAAAGAHMAELAKGWFIERNSRFKLPPPPALDSGRWADDYQEVKSFGQDSSTIRTPQESDVAHFYYEGSQLTWLRVARRTVPTQGKTLSEYARIVALVAMTNQDAFISGMYNKYTYQRWRPVTAIRAGDTDGNSKTAADPQWLPFMTTPAHPSYPSGHGALASASACILISYAAKGPRPLHHDRKYIRAGRHAESR